MEKNVSNIESKGSLGFKGIHKPTFASESKLAGSAGIATSTVRVSTAMTPRGIPPSLWENKGVLSVPLLKMTYPHSTGLGFDLTQ